MSQGRGVKGVHSLAVGQVHLTEEIRDLLILAVNRCYPRESNGSLKSSMELILHDFLEIPQILSPEDVDKLIRKTESTSICEALAKIGEKYLKDIDKVDKGAS